MQLTKRNIDKIRDAYNLDINKNLYGFIRDNPENMDVEELSQLAEMINNMRAETAAYYTDVKLLNEIEKNLPDFEKETIKILEPSAGVGNFIDILVRKYKKHKKILIYLNDIDGHSVEVAKLLNEKRNIPENFVINYEVGDFLNKKIKRKYDLIIGNPPFLKVNSTNSEMLKTIFFDDITKNLSGFFMQKALLHASEVIMVMPKYFLNNSDFSLVRKKVSAFSVEKIIDFGEKGFKGVLIETIAIFVNTNKEPNKTIAINITKKIKNVQEQSIMMDDEYPYWLLYRDEFFEEIARKLEFNIFKVYRDRQITNKKLKDTGDIRVLRSRNISRNGREILSIDGYDRYMDRNNIFEFKIGEFIDRDDVYLAPNMTYYPRVIKKEKNCIVNGSIAILEPKDNVVVTKKHTEYLSSLEFEKFYRIARNYSTRSLNIDKNSVFFFGLLK